jgi:5-methylcytosine-specific restriction enzyme A
VRREFSAKTKLAAWQRCGGVCECGCTTKLTGDRAEYDHRIPCGLGGGNDLDNCMVLLRGHHRTKTTEDVAHIAKAKRRELRHVGIRKPRAIIAWRLFNGAIRRVERER